MSSWSTLIAATGMKIDYENKKLTFSPVDKNISLPFIIPDVLGKVTFSDGKCNFKFLEGDLDGWKITVE
jgi:hypothetical protein